MYISFERHFRELDVLYQSFFYADGNFGILLFNISHSNMFSNKMPFRILWSLHTFQEKTMRYWPLYRFIGFVITYMRARYFLGSFAFSFKKYQEDKNIRGQKISGQLEKISGFHYWTISRRKSRFGYCSNILLSSSSI